MAERVFVVGVGMTDFVKPSARPECDYPERCGRPHPALRTPA